MRFQAAMRSRTLVGVSIAVALAVPVLTLPRLSDVNPWPALLGFLPWVVGKYLICPLRWRDLTGAGLSRWWHIRAYAESELIGLLTPGHVGADVWRVKRLTGTGMAGPDAVASVGIDRLVGAVALIAFVAFAGPVMPTSMLAAAVGLALAAIVVALVLRRKRPSLMPTRALPRPRYLVKGLAMSCLFQLSIVALLFGTVASTGHPLPPMMLLGAFGASQVAGAVPGPQGASPREGALVLALMALGVPFVAATGAVALTAAVAWLPALTFGGSSLLATRRFNLTIAAAAA